MPKRTLPITVVARETGISPDLLRKWEARHGFPKPVRTSSRARAYSLEQLDTLRQIKRLIAAGMRPGEAIRRCRSDDFALPPSRLLPNPSYDDIEIGLDAIKNHSAQELNAFLERSLASFGVQGFITEVAAPLTVAVGDAWLAGNIQVYEEHLFTATLSSLLSDLHRRLHLNQASPRILFATPPGELHTLGLDMVRVLFAEAGADCIPLGAQTPISEIAAAARAYEASIVALSYSSAFPSRLMNAGLTELRAQLPAPFPIWIGGAGALTASHLPPGIRLFITANEAIGAIRELTSHKS
jgi:methanogenic corrinoid protein MtbC1